MLVLHGEDDVICDVESARTVYDLSVSKDKRLEVFAGMGHQLIGESEEGVNAAFGVVFSWLVEKADKLVAEKADKLVASNTQVHV